MRDRSGRPGARTWIRRVRLMAAAAAVAACGNVTAGGATGDVETYMSGNGSRSSPATASRAAPDGTTPAAVALTFVGDVTATASLEIRQAGGPTVELTPLGPFTATADLEGTQEPLVADEMVPAGRYDSVRIVFTQVSADVTAGLEIGGVQFAGLVTVDLPTGGLEVVLPLDLDVPDGGLAAFVVDLNADAWVPLADAATGTVDPADFAAAVAVSLR